MISRGGRYYHVAPDGGHEAGECQLVGPALLHPELARLLVHPVSGDRAVRVEDPALSEV